MQANNIIKIENLYASINNTNIINNLNLSINAGEVHAIMGKNGSGKSTLAKVIAGHPNYEITQGNILLDGEDITHIETDERAHKGIFLAFQYPVEIPGVTNADFLRMSYNAKKKANKEEELDPLSFFDLMTKKLQQIKMSQAFLSRNVNEGFSGGEKKKNEILQMSLFENKLSILDEIDSGLDVDALKNIAYQINSLQNKTSGILLITHYQRLLDYIQPDFIHIMDKGQIIYTGNCDTAKEIEKYGYDIIKK